jgi:cytoskeletal protein RodZ
VCPSCLTGYINLRDVIEEKIQQRFNAISAPKEEGECTRPNTPPELSSLPPPPELSQRVDKIGEEVSELASKTATVLTTAQRSQEEFQELKSFWEVMKQAQEVVCLFPVALSILIPFFSQAMKQQLQNETLLRQRGEEIEKLKQQVLPLMKMSSAPPPSTADLEAVRAGVVARLAASINQEIAPVLAQTRESCREQLARHKQEVLDDIFKRLQSPINAQKLLRVLLAMDADTS